MNERNDLDGRRIAVLVADGFEKVELSVPMKALRLAGAEVDVVSLRRGRIRGVNLHEPAGTVRVNKTVQEADPANYDALFIPGGFISPDLLRQSVEARDFARAFDTSGKPIATLCHGPWVLASAGVLRGRTDCLVARHPGRRRQCRCRLARPGGRPRRESHYQSWPAGPGGIRACRYRSLLRDSRSSAGYTERDLGTTAG